MCTRSLFLSRRANLGGANQMRMSLNRSVFNDTGCCVQQVGGLSTFDPTEAIFFHSYNIQQFLCVVRPECKYLMKRFLRGRLFRMNVFFRSINRKKALEIFNKLTEEKAFLKICSCYRICVPFGTQYYLWWNGNMEMKLFNLLNFSSVSSSFK